MKSMMQKRFLLFLGLFLALAARTASAHEGHVHTANVVWQVVLAHDAFQGFVVLWGWDVLVLALHKELRCRSLLLQG